jgi:hypothetical protein
VAILLSNEDMAKLDSQEHTSPAPSLHPVSPPPVPRLSSSAVGCRALLTGGVAAQEGVNPKSTRGYAKVPVEVQTYDGRYLAGLGLGLGLRCRPTAAGT